MPLSDAELAEVAEEVGAARRVTGKHLGTKPNSADRLHIEKARVPLMLVFGAAGSVIGAALGIGIAWGGSRTEVTTVKAEVITVRAEVKQVQAEVGSKQDKKDAAEADARLRAVEQQGAANVVDHAAIKKDVGELKVDVKALDAKQAEANRKLDLVLVKLK